ncbi:MULTISPECIES: hypothetical protein [Paraburkholderia]|uniref:hypothetical protein n=1 Tax=Paraburkholderia TaxID=1822464 RepID=UPI002253288C|nr:MULTISPECIES: hypothetical protein [Paraburkholderia]MCX4164033.1 hypothetical protein [Paraburkholderia megapolitana]MDN7159528.1 hypothetical protein [Paraburkholderia sp. CHISQ3]MDQ6496575.1 hypothetical protein [Paraburkholderia megapolitana]
MKSFLTVAAAAVAATLAFGGVALAAQPTDDATAATNAQAAAADEAQSANERAGLPDLKAINRPAAEVSSKVDIDVPRTPSFYERSGSGTEITEYRDKGKPVEIDVRSNFGTRYQMSAPTDTSPTVRDNGRASTRLPSINLHY